MAKIPSYERQVEIQTPKSVRPAEAPNTLGLGLRAINSVGEANENLGSAISQGGQVLGAHVKEQQKLKNEAYNEQLELSYRKDLQGLLVDDEIETVNVNGQNVNRPKGILSRQLGQVEGATIDYDERGTKLMDLYLAKVKDPAYKTKLAQKLVSYSLSQRDNVIKHEAKQKRDDLINTFESSIKQRVEDAITANDGPSLRLAIENAQLTQDGLNKAKALDPVSSELALQKTKMDVIKKAIYGNVKNDLSGVKSIGLLESIKDDLKPEEYDELKDTVTKTVIKNQEMAQKAMRLTEARYIEEIDSKIIDGSLDIDGLSQYRGLISEKEYLKKREYILSGKNVSPATKAEVYNRLQDEFISLNIDSQDETNASLATIAKFRANVMDAMSRGEITATDGKSFLKDVSVAFDDKTKDEIRKNYHWWETLGNWADRNAGNIESTKARLTQEFRRRIGNNEDPQKVVQDIIMAEHVRMNPDAPAATMETIFDKQRPKEIDFKPAFNAIQRVGKGLGMGVAGTVEGFGGALKWMGAKDVGKMVSDHAKVMQDFYAVPDPKFADQVAAGFGSMGTFFIPGLGIARGVQMATAMPRLAAWLGVSASTALEATVEAGSTYERAIEKEMTGNEASKAANKTFWLNIPTIAVTNKLGLFGESGGQVARAIKSSGFEGFQEFSQSLISNIAVNDPAFAGAFESAAIGAITGGGMGIAVNAAKSMDELRQAKELKDKFDNPEDEGPQGEPPTDEPTPDTPQDVPVGTEDLKPQDNLARDEQGNPIEIGSLEDALEEIEIFKNNLNDLKVGNTKEAHIANIPKEIASERGIPQEIFIAQDKLEKLKEKHSIDVDDSFVENINASDELLVYKDNPNQINLIKKLNDGETLVVGARRFNGHFVVTGFKAGNERYLNSIKKRGEVINIAGRSLTPSSLGPNGLVPAGANVPGVSNITTSPNKNLTPPANSIADGLDKGEQIEAVNPLSGESITQLMPSVKSQFNTEDKKDIADLLDWESNMPNGERWSFIDESTGQRVVDGNPSGHSDIVQEIGPKETFKLLQKSLRGVRLTDKQYAKVKLLLEDYRTRVKPGIEALNQEIEDAKKELSESETAEVVRTFAEEEGLNQQLERPQKEELEGKDNTGGRLANERGSAYIPIPDLPKLDPKVRKDLNAFTDAALVPLSTRLAKINEGLRDVMRKFEFNKGMSTYNDLQKALPFMRKMEGMPTEDAAKLDLALKNVDLATINEIVNRNNIRAEYEQAREVLDDLYNRAREVGIDVSYIDDYFPRRVNDPEAFMDYLRNSDNWSAIQKAIKEEETRVGTRLNNEERAEFINKMLRGYGNSQLRITKPSNVKSRKIQVIDENMNSFYKNSAVTLQEYITAMNNAIEARKFFGLNNKDVEDSVGAYVRDLVDAGVITHSQEAEVRSIVEARFKERGTHGIWSFYKNLGYIYTMGSPISAITQIGDLAFSLYENGFYGTVKGLKSALGKEKVTKQDLGIDNIIEEFSDRGKTGKAVTKIFKAIGLEAMDNIGKETLINGALDKMTKQAKANDPELVKEVNRVFGEEAKQTLEDLKNGEPSVNVKYLLFSRLAKYQPIALSEMPEYYAKGGNLRILYMLKSYTIKQLDVFHNEVLREMKTDKKKAFGKLVNLAVALAALNASADVIKDVLLGRPIKLNDLVTDNLLRLVGFSKYATNKARRDGLIAGFYSTVLPPVPFIDDMFKDIQAKTRDIEDYRIWNALPVIGKFYYWWFGGGREYIENSKPRRKK